MTRAVPGKILKTFLMFLSLAPGMASATSSSARVIDGGPRLLYAYHGVITVCTGACDSVASLGKGATLSGQIHIQAAPSSSFGFADVSGADFAVLNDQAPTEPYDGSNASSSNPLPVTRIAWFRESAISAGVLFTTGGATGAKGELVGGMLLFQLDVPPFSGDDTWLIFDLASGRAQLCLYFEQLGCIPGATQAVVTKGNFELLGADSDGDGILDSVDNCTNDTNPLQVDANGDGIGNVCDADIAGPAGPGKDDCMINFFDLGRMKAVYFTHDPIADLVGPGNSEPDGTVAFFDLGRMKEMFFGPPGPSAFGCN